MKELENLLSTDGLDKKPQIVINIRAMKYAE
jgi:hypothetical protein